MGLLIYWETSMKFSMLFGVSAFSLVAALSAPTDAAEGAPFTANSGGGPAGAYLSSL